jgi:hypothetical protein
MNTTPEQIHRQTRWERARIGILVAELVGLMAVTLVSARG